MKGYCDICGTEIEIEMCCDGFMCGCQGMPAEPPVCSSDCYDKYMLKLSQNNANNTNNTIDLEFLT